jgi:antitoxin (DNA-binding transcriptional repressor) of toxin-antitoxin stability system
MVADAHAVVFGIPRHHMSEVLARVRRGETIDVTEHGQLIARIVPVGERQPTPVLARVVKSGRATLARRPGYRPRMVLAMAPWPGPWTRRQVSCGPSQTHSFSGPPQASGTPSPAGGPGNPATFPGIRRSDGGSSGTAGVSGTRSLA